MRNQSKILVLCLMFVLLATSSVFAKAAGYDPYYPYVTLEKNDDYMIQVMDSPYTDERIFVDKSGKTNTTIFCDYEIYFRNDEVKKEWAENKHPLCAEGYKVNYRKFFWINKKDGSIGCTTALFKIIAKYNQPIHWEENRDIKPEDMSEGTFERHLYDLTIDYLTKKGRI